MVLYVHRNRWLIWDGSPTNATSTFTQLLSSDKLEAISLPICFAYHANEYLTADCFTTQTGICHRIQNHSRVEVNPRKFHTGCLFRHDKPLNIDHGTEKSKQQTDPGFRLQKICSGLAVRILWTNVVRRSKLGKDRGLYSRSVLFAT